jgi:hypothetical protein
MMSDEYPLIPPPSMVRMSLFHVVDVMFRPGGVVEAPERGLVTSEVVEPFGATIETRVGTRFGLDDRKADTGSAIFEWGSPGRLATSVILVGRLRRLRNDCAAASGKWNSSESR